MKTYIKYLRMSWFWPFPQGRWIGRVLWYGSILWAIVIQNWWLLVLIVGTNLLIKTIWWAEHEHGLVFTDEARQRDYIERTHKCPTCGQRVPNKE